MEAIDIPDAECKTMVIKRLKDLRRRIDEFSENLKRWSALKMI